RAAQRGRYRGSGGARPPGRGGEGRPAPATAHRHRVLPAGAHRWGHTREEGSLLQEGPLLAEEEKEEGPQGAREGRDEEDRGAGEVAGAERWADQPACRPGSVLGSHPSRITVAGDLQRSTRELGLAPSSVPCLTLLPVGFAVPTSSPRPRWSLTPPFRPYRLLPAGRGRRSAFCGTVPRITPGGCYPPPFQVEPGLSSAPLLRGR